MNDEHAVTASREAARGAIYGAVKWGAATAVLGGLGHAMSPIYRGLTLPFKLYIQMSGMIIGGWVEADHRVREYEAWVRMQNRIRRDRAKWKAFEDEYGPEDDK